MNPYAPPETLPLAQARPLPVWLDRVLNVILCLECVLLGFLLHALLVRLGITVFGR